MKILFVAPSYKPAFIYGGPTVVIALLAEQLVRNGHEVTVYTTSANGATELDVKLGLPVNVDGVTVFYFKRITKDHTHISPSLWGKLNKNIKDFDVVHIHSWWNFCVIGAAWICMKNNIKPIISPHGMFSNYILNANNSFFKKYLHAFVGKRLLENSWLHVSTDMEWEESHNIISDWKGEVISNLVELPKHSYERKQNEIFTIGFLSRIDPKKGLDILIKALSRISKPYKLLIAGDGDERYVKFLKKELKERNIENNVEWVGWKKGESKFDFFISLDLYALTSHSENFAIVVIESLSVGTPVLLSDQVGLYKYVLNNNLGWVTELDEEQIALHINMLIAEKEKKITINNDAPGVIRSDFEPNQLSQKYVLFYERVMA